jgi:hypothetical protein
MAYASRSGRARTSASSPQAFAVCDRCGIWYNHVNLRWQFDYRGTTLQNIRLLVCNTCYDTPQSQLRAIVLPADPVPIINPRVESYASNSTDRRQVSGYNTTNVTTGIPVPMGDTRVTTLNSTATANTRVTQETGEPPGGKNQLPGTDPNAVTYKNVVNVSNNGSGLIRITVTVTSGMITNQRVIIKDVVGATAANGTWVITVIDKTHFDLQGSTFAGAYTSGGYVINNPSLPYGFDEIPKTGPL